MTFDVTKHPRGDKPANTGQWSAKDNSAPESGLPTADLDVVVDEFLASARHLHADPDFVRSELLDPNYLGEGVPETPGAYPTSSDKPGNYDFVVRHARGAVGFYKGSIDEPGELHRTDGPALFHEDGSLDYYLHGQKLTPPAPGAVLVSVTPASNGMSAVQDWEVDAEGKDTVTVVGPEIEYRREGELHRDGGPAVVGHGEEVWCQYGRVVASPIPPEPTITTHPGDYTTVTGHRYEEGATIKTVAGKLRYDVKHAARLGVVPRGADAKVSYDSRTKTVRIEVKGLLAEDLYAEDRLEPGRPFYTPEAGAMFENLNKIGRAYARETRQAGTDYDDHNFQLQVIAVPTNPSWRS